MESEDDGSKRKIISPKYGVELTQKEIDVITKCQKDAIFYHALPLAVIYSGAFWYSSRKNAQKLGALRGLIGISATLVGWISGVYIGGLKLDSKILQECPDGNAAKIILAQMGKGEMPRRVNEVPPPPPESEVKRGESISYQSDVPRTQGDSQQSQKAKKTNAYGDVIE